MYDEFSVSVMLGGIEALSPSVEAGDRKSPCEMRRCSSSCSGPLNKDKTLKCECKLRINRKTKSYRHSVGCRCWTDSIVFHDDSNFLDPVKWLFPTGLLGRHSDGHLLRSGHCKSAQHLDCRQLPLA